jgi:outer membrane protein OmpA-like peptidoglycan-associated protein
MISKNIYLTAILATTVLVGACTPDLDTLEKTSAQPGDAFTEDLAEDYKIVAQEEKTDGSYGRAEMFARKGLGAAGGEMVQPIDPIKANVPPADVQELGHARSILADLFSQRVDLKLPNQMAAAQVNFDCWVSELANDNAEGAARCKANFMNDLNQIQAALQTAQPELFMTFFNSGKANIDEAGMQILQTAAQEFQNSGKKEILVLGYTDLVGTNKFNIHLSQLRADAGKAALISFGVPADSIRALGQGDSNPLVATDSANRENRRIEVILR